jgi:hypothetical protein
MRTAAIGLTLLVLTAGPTVTSPPAAHATSFTCRGLGKEVRWSERRDPSDARIAITTESGEMTLLLTDRDVVFQLSDRAHRRVRRDLKDAKDDQDDVIASVVAAVVTNTVREVLDHSFVCQLRDLHHASYEDGCLVLTGRRGNVVFGSEDECDSDGMRGFSERDARAFVREFQRVKTRQ